MDEAGIIKTGDKNDADELTATAGINKIRDVLRMPGHVVRFGAGCVRDAAAGGNSGNPKISPRAKY